MKIVFSNPRSGSQTINDDGAQKHFWKKLSIYHLYFNCFKSYLAIVKHLNNAKNFWAINKCKVVLLKQFVCIQNCQTLRNPHSQKATTKKVELQ